MLQKPRRKAPVARMPPGVGIVITMVPAVNGAIGVAHGITEMRPTAVGSSGTAGRCDFFCSIGKMRHGNVPSLHRCYGFYGLEHL